MAEDEVDPTAAESLSYSVRESRRNPAVTASRAAVRLAAAVGTALNRSRTR